MITQYHFTSWPDHDVPEYATSILAYHRRIKKDYNPSQGPMVVHCRSAQIYKLFIMQLRFNKFLLLKHASAGVGRTGTLIAIDTLLEQVEKAKIVDVCGVITKTRHQRMKMVQTTVSVKRLLKYKYLPLFFHVSCPTESVRIHT